MRSLWPILVVIGVMFLIAAAGFSYCRPETVVDIKGPRAISSRHHDSSPWIVHLLGLSEDASQESVSIGSGNDVGQPLLEWGAYDVVDAAWQSPTQVTVSLSRSGSRRELPIGMTCYDLTIIYIWDR